MEQQHKQDPSDTILDEYFDVVPANTPALLEDIYSLRYQVYCVEHSFENPANYPDQRETDRYDTFARHIALRYRPTGLVVGTVRLVFPTNPLDPCLPLLAALDGRAQAELRQLRGMAEVSRYVVSKAFRRRHGEAEFPDLGFAFGHSTCRRLMPHLTVGLLRGALYLASSHHVRHLCACMRPALIRLLKEFGLTFRPIGPAVEYHGLRQPCIALVDELKDEMATYRTSLYQVISRGLLEQSAEETCIIGGTI